MTDENIYLSDEEREEIYVQSFKSARDQQYVDNAYKERNIASVLFAKMALRLGYSVSVQQDDKTPHSLLYVQLPEGQFSWHIHEVDKHLLEGLPRDVGIEWDGTFLGKDAEFVKNL